MFVPFKPGRRITRPSVRAIVWPLICTDCYRAIPRGEQYVADVRHRERVNRAGAVVVEDAQTIAVYHQECAPGRVPVTGGTR